MAEDDDDETFGDFSFASNPQINNNDDDWGDFLQSPQQSKPSDSIVSAPRFVKPSGALPLSIFGDVEEEEGGGDAVVSSSGGVDSVSSGNGIGDLRSIKKSESSIVLDPVGFSGSGPNLRTLSSLTFDMSGGNGKRESNGGDVVANGVGDDGDDDDDDDDDDGWEFKDAFPESSNAWNVNNEVWNDSGACLSLPKRVVIVYYG